MSLVFIKILLNCASFLFDSLGFGEEEPTFGDVFGFSVLYRVTVVVGFVLLVLLNQSRQSVADGKKFPLFGFSDSVSIAHKRLT